MLRFFSRRTKNNNNTKKNNKPHLYCRTLPNVDVAVDYDVDDDDIASSPPPPPPRRRTAADPSSYFCRVTTATTTTTTTTRRGTAGESNITCTRQKKKKKKKQIMKKKGRVAFLLLLLLLLLLLFLVAIIVITIGTTGETTIITDQVRWRAPQQKGVMNVVVENNTNIGEETSEDYYDDDRRHHHQYHQNHHPIQFWYGPVQHFGHLGIPQRWINILGNIQHSKIIEDDDDDAIIHNVTSRHTSYFWLNGKVNERRQLHLGGDLHRLALPGDFNIEIDWNQVQSGRNILTVSTTTNINNGGGANVYYENTVTLMVWKDVEWRLPYAVDFTSFGSNSSSKSIQDVVQVVDGHWEFRRKNLPSSADDNDGDDSSGGIRTVQRYYDRFLTLGDNHRWTNYETKVKLIIHDFTPPEKGPPTYNCSHVSVGTRWRGHYVDQYHPHRKYYPVGAFGEFMLRNRNVVPGQTTTTGRWRIVFDGNYKEKPPLKSNTDKLVILNEPLWIRTQVQTIIMPDGNFTRYSFKQWQEALVQTKTNESSNGSYSSRAEPKEWDIVGYESMEGDLPSGALALAMHNSDVTIQEISVEPIY